MNWDAEAVRARIIEMAETMKRVPKVKGPKQFGSSMPERIPDYPTPSFTKIRATAAELTRMEETWTWINALPVQEDRELLYGWSWVKVRKGFTLSAFAEQNGMNDRFLLRQILMLCHQISEQLNRSRSIRLNNEDLLMSETQPDIASTNVTSRKCETHWTAPDNRPQIDPAAPPERIIEPRNIRAR